MKLNLLSFVIRRWSFVLTFTLLAPPLVHAQTAYEEPSLVRYGLFGSYDLNQHTVKFKEIVPSCCNKVFPNVNNSSWTAGALFEIPIVGSFGISLRAAYSPLSTNFATDSLLPLSSIGANQPRAIPVRFGLETKLASIDIEPTFTFRPIERLSIYAGMRAALFIQSNFRQYEQLLDNSVVYADTRTNTRADVSGSIPTRNAFVPFLLGGISYEIPISPTISVAPEIFYSYKLGSLLNNETWQVNTLRLGVSVRFSPAPTIRVESSPSQLRDQRKPDINKTPIDKQQNKIDQVEKMLAPPTAKIFSVSGIVIGSTNTQQVTSPIVKVEEFAASGSKPLLNAVFFDEKESEIPARYHRLKPTERAKFQVDNLASLGVLDTYYQMLNILGKRMSSSPKTKITLTGYADGLKEANNRQLALQRVESVKKYLKDMWSIDDKRVTVKVSGSEPLSSSSANARSRAEEQRRVDIQSETSELLDELRFDYTQRGANPRVLKMKFDINAPAGLKQWKLDAVEADSVRVRTLKTFRGTDTYPEILEWIVAATPQDTLPAASRDIALRLEATDSLGRTGRAPFSFVPMELLTISNKRKSRKPDERVDGYTVIPSSYAAPLMADDPNMQRTIKKIQSKLTPDVKVNIISDAGDGAQTVAKALNLPQAKVSTSTQPLYNTTLPEGRFYNRAVQVDVRTPLK